MTGAFVASNAVEIVPASALFLTTLVGAPPSTLVMLSAGLACAGALAQIGIYAFALRGLVRGAPRVPWIAVVALTILALVAYPVRTASSYGIMTLLAHRGNEALAEYAMGSTYVHFGAGLAHVAITAGALIAAATMWSRRTASPSGDTPAAG